VAGFRRTAESAAFSRAPADALLDHKQHSRVNSTVSGRLLGDYIFVSKSSEL